METINHVREFYTEVKELSYNTDWSTPNHAPTATAISSTAAT